MAKKLKDDMAEAAPESAEAPAAAESAPAEAKPKKYRVKVGRHVNYRGGIHFFAPGQEISDHHHDVKLLQEAHVELELIEG